MSHLGWLITAAVLVFPLSVSHLHIMAVLEII